MASNLFPNQQANVYHKYAYSSISSLFFVHLVFAFTIINVISGKKIQCNSANSCSCTSELTPKANDEMYASFHSINGIDDTFSWGGKNLNKYMLVIKPGNSGYFYDFTDAKKGEKRESQQTLKCNREIYELSSKEVDNYFEAFENVLDPFEKCMTCVGY